MTARDKKTPPLDRGVTVGELVRRQRRSKGQTQEEVAEALAVNQSTVAKWERGEQPRAERLGAIAAYLGRPLDEVIAVYHDQVGATTRLVDPAALQHQMQQLAAEMRALTKALHQFRGREPGSGDDGTVAAPLVAEAPRPKRKRSRRWLTAELVLAFVPADLVLALAPPAALAFM